MFCLFMTTWSRTIHATIAQLQPMPSVQWIDFFKVPCISFRYTSVLHDIVIDADSILMVRVSNELSKNLLMLFWEYIT